MRRWEGLVDGYMRECEARGIAPATRASREAELFRCGRWLKGRRPRPVVEEIRAELLVEYIRRRTAFRAKSTVCSVISHLRCLGEYLVREGFWSSNPLRWIKGPKIGPWSRVPKRIGRAHLEALWKEAAQKPEGFLRAQATTILAVLYGTGVRRGEIERMDVHDWNRDDGTLLVDGRKTGRERRVPVPVSVARYLEAYLPVRQNVLEKSGRLEEPALFVARSGQRLRGEGVGRMIHGLAKKAGVPLVSVHQFRHTCASDLIEEGLTLPQVQQVLGHAAITSTMWYLSLSDPDLRRAIAKHPLREILHECGSGRSADPAPSVVAETAALASAACETGGSHE